MQSNFLDGQPMDRSEMGLHHTADEDNLEVNETSLAIIEPTQFQTRYIDGMELQADVPTVERYFDAHEGWFRRCALPMVAEPLGQYGYALVIGKFGAFGYEVEPKVGLELLPGENQVYRIRTVPVPGYDPGGYEVDYNAVMQLEALPSRETAMTRVSWDLDLKVYIQFPKFIHKLPQSLIQKTGDRLLSKIVHQVSRRLTHKVIEDFHQSLGMTPPKTKRRKG